MKNFSKRVKLVGGSRIQLHYPLSTGQDLFEARKEYDITSRKDFDRLMERGDFVCLNPDVKEEPVLEETKVEDVAEDTSFLASVKNRPAKAGKKSDEVVS